MVINSTNAVDAKIQDVLPLSVTASVANTDVDVSAKIKVNNDIEYRLSICIPMYVNLKNS